MSVITSLTATPNRMKIVWDYLGNRGPHGVRAEELQRLIGPSSLHSGRAQDEDSGSGTTIGDGVIGEMRNLGLITRVEDGTIRIASGDQTEHGNVFLRLLERRLLDPVEAKQYGQGAFPSAMAWFLAQDPVNPLEWGQNHSRTVLDDCGEDTGSFELTNLARCQQFVYWARYLGFAWRLQIERTKEVVIPDPAPAILRNLRKVIIVNQRRPIMEVMSEISDVLPVLEGGVARDDLESHLTSEKQRPDKHLSRSTSFALERLERDGQISLQRLADAEAVNLQLVSGLRAMSHITLRHEE